MGFNSGFKGLIDSQKYEDPGVELHGNFWCIFPQYDGLHKKSQTYGHYNHEADFFRHLSQGLGPGVA